MKKLIKTLNSIESDKSSGSSAMVDALVDSLIEIVPLMKHSQMPEIVGRLSKLAHDKPHFAVFLHLYQVLQASEHWSADLNQYRKKYNDIDERIGAAFISSLSRGPKKFLLHSNSKTVLHAFKKLRGKADIRIFQTKSLPGKEGLVQARLLRQLGYEVTVVNDNPPASVLNQIDYLVTGADLILDDQFINKSGTKLLAYQLNKLNKLYYVLADPRKMATVSPSLLPPAFEYVPRNLVSAVITGDS